MGTCSWIIQATGRSDPVLTPTDQYGMNNHSSSITDRVLVTAIGLRDPYQRREDQKKDGPVLTALSSFRSLNWEPSKVIIVFVPSAPLNERVSEMQRVLHSHGTQYEHSMLDGVSDPSDYAACTAALTPRIFPANLHKSDVRILIGPGTPALNFALLAFQQIHLPTARLWLVKNPSDRLQSIRLESSTVQCVSEIKLGTPKLPRITQEHSTTRELELERELARLKNQNLQQDLDTASSTLPTDRVLTIGEMEELYRLNVIRAITQLTHELQRAPSHAKIAELLNCSKQNVQHYLKSKGIKL